jgi:hypothetical protein
VIRLIFCQNFVAELEEDETLHYFRQRLQPHTTKATDLGIVTRQNSMQLSDSMQQYYSALGRNFSMAYISAASLKVRVLNTNRHNLKSFCTCAKLVQCCNCSG